jgi:RNA 3'-terminal phosphate cyclase (ATP)
MLELDGADGGGQLLRSALALSVVTGRPFELSNVRGERPNPGLRPQHLAAVEATAAACDAEVAGAAEGSEQVEFDPGSVGGGEIAVDVGTAGSVTLVFDALLPLLSVLDAPLTVTVTGGTDVKWSPTMDYYRRVKLPLLRRHGAQVALDLDRAGYYPTGGGRARLSLAPADLSPFSLVDRGAFAGARLYSSAAFSLSDRDVAERQADALAASLRERDRAVRTKAVTYRETASPGSALALHASFEGGTAGFDAVGERGKTSEAVADEVLEAFDAFVRSGAAVDRHLADQLVVFLALAGGRISVPAVTEHVQTSLDLLSAFDRAVTVSADDPPVLSAPADSST